MAPNEFIQQLWNELNSDPELGAYDEDTIVLTEAKFKEIAWRIDQTAWNDGFAAGRE